MFLVSLAFYSFFFVVMHGILASKIKKKLEADMRASERKASDESLSPLFLLLYLSLKTQNSLAGCAHQLKAE